MRSRSEFMTDFFDRLAGSGFRVETLPEGSDLAAEVYNSNTLFCVITRDGEIIFEAFDSEKARALEQTAENSRKALHCHTTAPFADMERMEPVNLTGGSYVKVFESAVIVLLCRKSGLFGYEFVTCQKALPKHNSKRFYREQYFYDATAAQQDFMKRSGLMLQEALHFSHEELYILVSCCARCVMLDNELDADAQKSINDLMKKIEESQPPQQELSPRYCYQNEIG
ncbi:hypothetical protein LAD12857_35350 [Lacrimispora amygdalina]|uniref:Uncharacterized protein n=2 Tax=Lacrimispora TaxID=2719231 RepID=A0ABX1VVB5_9FIRM|nr:hypothetical protein [Lacrimispora defluvii]NNJ31980.1 hypothetical protein [Lacrimispora defluvii]